MTDDKISVPAGTNLYRDEALIRHIVGKTENEQKFEILRSKDQNGTDFYQIERNNKRFWIFGSGLLLPKYPNYYCIIIKYLIMPIKKVIIPFSALNIALLMIIYQHFEQSFLIAVIVCNIILLLLTEFRWIYDFKYKKAVFQNKDYLLRLKPETLNKFVRPWRKGWVTRRKSLDIFAVLPFFPFFYGSIYLYFYFTDKALTIIASLSIPFFIYVTIVILAFHDRKLKQ